ncbi:aromatic-ring-hydroxylating dioxygenase subunit beta [Burkholderia glumae]|uniref:aromatic-ring-hydroxylating dioxygenase subunit beta n=1 Tax=Burkholderia glumae TaxID=337 RepID=UPI00146324EF|nr:aromatic-ring-hydroxylating dioxygenase subunit beta [Burkholderia glumae]QJP69811.1 aromatic-ring-hydroxylating dioxygenase subunit beta [Burkholderia glumae]
MMNQHNTPGSDDTFTRALRFIWREAEMLDRREYREWLTLWDEAGHYVVPIDRTTTDFAATLNYAYDDHEMRAKRVERMTSGHSASAADAARTVRTVSRFTLASRDANTIEMRSAQIVIAYKRAATTIFAADVAHTLRFEGGEARLVQKVIRLIDSTEALNAIGFLL